MSPRTVAASAVLVLAVACGGDSGRELSEEEYVEEFSAICGDGAADVAEVSEDAEGSSDLSEVADAARGAERVAQNAVDDIEGLDQPEGVDEAQALVDVLDDQAKAYADLTDAAEDDDRDRVEELRSEIEARADEVDDAASAAGIDCEPDDIGPADQFSDASDVTDQSDFTR